MSPSDVKKLYKDRITVKRQDDGKEVLTIPKYELFGTNFDVSFFWKDGTKLSRVVVGIVEPEGDLSHVAGNLIASLKFKYGNGQVLEQKHTDTSFLTIGDSTTTAPGTDSIKIRWVFPSTLITYSHLIVQPRTSIITVIYEPNEAGKL